MPCAFNRFCDYFKTKVATATHHQFTIWGKRWKNSRLQICVGGWVLHRHERYSLYWRAARPPTDLPIIKYNYKNTCSSIRIFDETRIVSANQWSCSLCSCLSDSRYNTCNHKEVQHQQNKWTCPSVQGLWCGCCCKGATNFKNLDATHISWLSSMKDIHNHHTVDSRSEQVLL